MTVDAADTAPDLAADAAVASMRTRVDQLAMGYGMSAILFAAIELGVFDALALGPLAPPALAAKLGASPSGTARLGAALCTLGLLSTDHEDRFVASPAAIAILAGDGTGRDSLVQVLRYHQRHVAPLMSRLAVAVRELRPQHAAWSFASPDAASRHSYDELLRHPDEYRVFLGAMDRFAIGAGDEIAARFDLSKARRLIDMGGGSGRIARELLAAAPQLTAELLDVPLACELSTAAAQSAGADVAARFTATPADLTKPLPESVAPGDVVLLAGVLTDFAPDDQLRILDNAASRLRPGGVLLVNETLLDADRAGPTVPVLLSVLMLVAMPGDSFTLPDLRALLNRGGFWSIHHHPPVRGGRRDLVVARRTQPGRTSNP